MNAVLPRNDFLSGTVPHYASLELCWLLSRKSDTFDKRSITTGLLISFSDSVKSHCGFRVVAPPPPPPPWASPSPVLLSCAFLADLKLHYNHIPFE